MRIRRFETSLWLPRPPGEVFPFFADAHNLEAITPPFLRFAVTTPRPIDMREGTLIDYRLRLRGVPIRWRTRIAAWDPPRRFVDEQVAGPYRLWRHEHRFEPWDGGTRCTDTVEYAVPGGPLLEGVIDRLLVSRDVRAIFEFRQRRLAALFAAPGRNDGVTSPEHTVPP